MAGEATRDLKKSSAGAEPHDAGDVIVLCGGTCRPCATTTETAGTGMMNKRKALWSQSHMEVELTTKSTAKLGPDIKAKIGQQLRAMYSDVVNQGVPDRFSEILRRLDQTGADEGGTHRKTEDEGSNGPAE
jgi:hypothetical protein